MTWESRCLNDLCSFITDGKHGDCPNEPDSGYYFISAKDVYDGKIHYENARQITQSDFAETHRRTDLKPGDILLTNSGTIGRLAIASDIETTSKTTFQKSVAILKPITDIILPEFLYYSLAFNTKSLENAAGGAAQKNLLLGELRRFVLSVPIISTQKKIVDILAAYDSLIENNRRRIQLLEQSARLLYREWFVYLRFPGHEHVRIIDGVPEGWEKSKLSDICCDIRETVKPEQVKSDTPYIGLEHMPRNSITLMEWGKSEQVTSDKFKYRKGDILFGKIRPYFHKVGLTFTDGITSSDAIVIRNKTQKLAHLLLMVVSSDHFVAVSSKTVREGSKMPRADWKVLKQYKILIPPLVLLENFNEIIKSITSQLEILSFQIHKLQQARDILLPRLMNGEIIV